MAWISSQKLPKFPGRTEATIKTAYVLYAQWTNRTLYYFTTKLSCRYQENRQKQQHIMVPLLYTALPCLRSTAHNGPIPIYSTALPEVSAVEECRFEYNIKMTFRFNIISDGSDRLQLLFCFAIVILSFAEVCRDVSVAWWCKGLCDAHSIRDQS